MLSMKNIKFRLNWMLILVILLTCLFLTACSGQQPPAQVSPPDSPQASPQAPAQAPPQAAAQAPPASSQDNPPPSAQSPGAQTTPGEKSPSTPGETTSTADRPGPYESSPVAPPYSGIALSSPGELVSPDKKYKAFIKETDKGKSLLLQKGSQELVLVENVPDQYALQWAPNSKHLFLGTAGSEMGQGRVFAVSNGYPILEFRYISGPAWSPDAQKICVTGREDRRNLGEEEGDSLEEGSLLKTDVLVYNLDNEFIKRVASGTKDYYYTVDGWGKDWKIRLTKKSGPDGSPLEKTERLFAHHIWSLDTTTGEKKLLGHIKNIQYEYFDPSPDRKWLSLVKYISSAGEGALGYPGLFNMETGEVHLLPEHQTFIWYTAWFADSSRVILRDTEILDVQTRQVQKIKLPAEDIFTVGSKPSPDGSKIAAFAIKYEHAKAGEGEPLILYLLDTQGNILNTIETTLLPRYSFNVLIPVPVNFEWLSDNETIIMENWDQQKYACDVYILNTSTGEVRELLKNGLKPLVSPDGKMAAAVGTKGPDKYPEPVNITLLDLERKLLRTLPITGLKVKLAGYRKLLWGADTQSIYLEGYYWEKNNLRTIVIRWDLTGGESKVIELEPESQVLYTTPDDKAIVYITGSIT